MNYFHLFHITTRLCHLSYAQLAWSIGLFSVRFVFPIKTTGDVLKEVCLLSFHRLCIHQTRYALWVFPEKSNPIIRSIRSRRVIPNPPPPPPQPQPSQLQQAFIKEKKVTSLVRVNGACAWSRCLSKGKLTRPGEPKWKSWPNQEGDPIPSQKGNPTSWVTFLAEKTFCFSCKRFITFCKDICETLTHTSFSGKRVTLYPGQLYL